MTSKQLYLSPATTGREHRDDVVVQLLLLHSRLTREVSCWLYMTCFQHTPQKLMSAGMCGTGNRQRQGHNFPELPADATLIFDP